MPQLPPYFLSRPLPEPDADTAARFDRVFDEAVAKGPDESIHYSLSEPKWQFLCYLCDTRGVLVHGSGNPHISEFEPRKSNDIGEFGDREAVYAASDGIWAMYFAIVDRDRYVTSLVNACARVVDEDGQRTEPYYYFSVNADALPHSPWRQGTIYLLPREPFEQQPPFPARGLTVEAQQWASPVPVKPLAKLTVDPGDFPFLQQIHGHDMATVAERARANPDGFPWLDEES